MKKTELIKTIREKVEGVNQKEVGAVLDALSEVIIDVLTKNRDEKIALPDIGTFSVKHVAERSGVTALAGGKEWTKPAHDEIQFKISKNIKNI